MEFFYGLLTSLVFLFALLFFFYLGTRYGKKGSAPMPVGEDKQTEIEQFNKDFKALMTYDVDTALRRKKVTSLE